MLNADTYILRNDKMPWRIIENEAVLVDIKKGEVIHFNEVGAEVWSNLEQKKKLGDIIQNICTVFDVDEETAKGDIIGFLKEGIEKNLIITSDE